MLYKTGRHFLIAILIVQAFLWPQITLATNPPNLLSPSDNSTEGKSPKLAWEYSGECIGSGSCFRIEVDNNSDFSSAEKSTYTNSSSYSPQGLTDGAWNWRVKAKDKTEKWSDWSKVFKFNVQSSSAISPAPSPTQTSKTQASSKNESSFSLKDIPGEINSDQEFEASVSLKLPDKPNTGFYLKGAFKKDGSTNYFGQTYSNEWVANGEKYSKQFKITTDSSGTWEGKIKVRPDGEDSGFDGTGDYVFKVGRYSDTGSGPTWSNELKIKINAVEKPDPSIEEQAAEILDDEEVDTQKSKIESTPSYEIKIASVAGVSEIRDNTNSPEETKILGERNINWFLIFLGLGILISGGGFVFYKLKKEKIDSKSYN